MVSEFRKAKQAVRIDRMKNREAHRVEKRKEHVKNMEARRNRKNLRVAQGRGLQVAKGVKDSIDKTIAGAGRFANKVVDELGKTVRDKNTAGTVTAAGNAMNPVKLPMKK